jgi:hypothetical protein
MSNEFVVKRIERLLAAFSQYARQKLTVERLDKRNVLQSQRLSAVDRAFSTA